MKFRRLLSILLVFSLMLSLVPAVRAEADEFPDTENIQQITDTTKQDVPPEGEAPADGLNEEKEPVIEVIPEVPENEDEQVLPPAPIEAETEEESDAVSFPSENENKVDASEEPSPANGENMHEPDGVLTDGSQPSEEAIDNSDATTFGDEEPTGVPTEYRLSNLTFRNGIKDDKAEYRLEPAFNPEVKEYTIVVPDTVNPMTGLGAWATLADTASGDIKINYTDVRSGRQMSMTLPSGQVGGKPLSGSCVANSLVGNTLTVTVGGKDAYVIHLVRKATLSNLIVNDQAGEPVIITPDFDKGIFSYTAEIGKETVLSVMPTATAAQATIKVGDAEYVAGEAIQVTPVWTEEKTYSLSVVVAGGEETRDSVYVLKFSQPEPAVERIEIEKAPDKIRYLAGETFDPTGLIVHAIYKDGSKRQLKISDLLFEPDGMLSADTTVVTFFYGEHSVVQTIEVLNVLQGDGSIANPFQITSASDFETIRTVVATGNAYAGNYFVILNDISFSQNWEPIGSLKPGASWDGNGTNIFPFSGYIDGQGHTLSFESGCKPLFNYVREASVSNISIYAPFMDGYALVDKYVVDYGADGSYGDGEGGSYRPGCPDTIDINNVIIKSGSIIKKGGFLGGFASGANVVNINGCLVEKGVKIGCNADGSAAEQSTVGSFAGMFNGTITNSISYADVYGTKSVGGIVGYKGQSMGPFDISNCTFAGTVNASGSYCGGIAGSGYSSSSAPNTPMVTIKDCNVTGKVTGTQYVGGILGAEPAMVQCWDNGIGYIQNNVFTGTVSGSSDVGAIIGYMHSLNAYTNISNNYYSDGCGSDTGIARVWLIDTSFTNPTVVEGVQYINTAETMPNIQGIARTSHNRIDDPLGADADKLAQKLGSTEATMESMVVSGYKNQYVKGEAFTLEGATVTVSWSDGTTTNPDVSELTVQGYDANTLGEQEVTLTYETLSCKIKVTVSAEAVTTPTMSSLAVTGIKKTTYVQGQKLDLTGAVYTVTMSDGSKHTLSTEEAAKVTVTGYHADKVGVQNVILTYESVSTSVRITVIPKTVGSLKISGSYKTAYLIGDKLDLTGMVVTAVWNDGSESNVALSDVTVSGYDSQKQGDQTLTLSYSGVSATISVKVSKPETEIKVTFSLLGDGKHGETGGTHTYANGGLSTWIGATTYTVSNNMTVKDVLEKALTAKGYSWSNPTGNYVVSINGLAEFDNGSKSGWMYTLNGSYPLLGVAEQYLNDGDVIVFHYTDDYTVEKHGFTPDEDDESKKAVEDAQKLIDAIGTVSYTDASKNKIDAARKAYDALSFAQKKEVGNYAVLEAAEKAYADLKKVDDKKKAADVDALINKIDATITLDSEAGIAAARTAYNKLTADQKALVQGYQKLTNAEAALAKLKASEEDKKKAKDVMDLINAIGTVTTDSEDKIKAARDAYDKLTDIQKALVTNLNKLEEAEKKLEELSNRKGILEAYKITGDFIENLGEPEVGAVGGEWMVIGLARSGRKVADSYYEKAVAYIKENIDANSRLHNAKSTDNSRMILALTAIGKDATDVDGYNLIAGLSSMEYIQKQGINGPMWALLALDSGNYPVPADGDVTREALIQVLLDAQLADGGWALFGENSDSDLTGMALQALAPYYGNSNVKAAVDKALVTLSKMQNNDGSYSSVDGASSESIAQVVVALTALGIDPHTDARFVKNGNSAMDALLTYFVQGGGFKHILAGELNGMATEQSYYALTAYSRFVDGKTALYNMTDTLNKGGDVQQTEEPTQTEPAETTPAVTEPNAELPVKQNSFRWQIVIVVVVLGAAAIVVVVINRKKFSGKQ